MRNRERSRLNRGLNILLTTVLGLVFVVSTATTQTNKTTHVVFSDVTLKTAIRMLAKQLKLNVVFDDSFRDLPKYELELDDVTLESAMNIIFLHNKLAARYIEENTIIVTLDTEMAQSRLSAYSKWTAKTVKK